MDRMKLGIPKERNLAGLEVIRLWQEMIEEKRTDRQPSLQPFGLGSGFSLRYSEDTVKNVLGKAGWYLVYDPGFSIVEMAQIVGSDPQKPPCRDGNNNGWMLDSGSPWAKESQEPCCYLIGTPILCGLDFNSQEVAFCDLGEGRVERVPCRLAIVFGISHFLAFGDYGFGDCHHLGPEESNFGKMKANAVVAFGSKGFALYNFPRGVANKGIGVCPVWKFDF
jgi:hypothetical protein